MKRNSGVWMLILASFIWGTCFAAQAMGMDHIGPYTFTASRSFVGAAVLVPVLLIGRRFGMKKQGTARELWLGGLCCGVALTVAANLQQVGMQYTSVGNAGFLTALYIVIVPVLGIFMKKKLSASLWVSVAMAVAGAYLLSIREDFSIGLGDSLEILCALVFSFHILLIDHFSRRVNGVALSAVQFLVTGLLTSIPALLLEDTGLSDLGAGAGAILYAGVLSSGVAYTLQILGQKRTAPTVASLAMSLESVFAALSGWAILHQSLGLRECVGCGLVFAAVILAQVPPKRQGK